MEDITLGPLSDKVRLVVDTDVLGVDAIPAVLAAGGFPAVLAHSTPLKPPTVRCCVTPESAPSNDRVIVAQSTRGLH